MTSSRPGTDEAIEVPVTRWDRSYPPCRCGCEGRPESLRTLVGPEPYVIDRTAQPPARPYRPVQVGELVRDVSTGRLGSYRGQALGEIYLRPVSGGREWSVQPRWIDRPPVADEPAAGRPSADEPAAADPDFPFG